MTLDGTRSYVLGTGARRGDRPGPRRSGSARGPGRCRGGPAGGRVLLDPRARRPCGGARPRRPAVSAREPAGSAETLSRLGLAGRALEDGETLELRGRPGEERPARRPSPRSTRPVTPPTTSATSAEPGRRLFTGDLVLGEGSSAILHPDGSVADCLASLARLIALRPSLLLPGHGPPVEDAVRKLEDVPPAPARAGGAGAGRAGRRAPRRFRRSGEAVYGELPQGLVWAADASVAAHLAALAARGEQVPAFDGFGAAEDGHV